MMLETVIESPVDHQGVKQMVLDLQASMRDVPEPPHRHLRRRDRRRPPPGVDLRLFDPVIGFQLSHGLFHRLRDIGPSFTFLPTGVPERGREEVRPGALAAWFSTGSLNGDKATEEEGLIMKDWNKAGAGATFLIG